MQIYTYTYMHIRTYINTVYSTTCCFVVYLDDGTTAMRSPVSFADASLKANREMDTFDSVKLGMCLL